MGSNFTVFTTAVSALSANAQALSVASNNIANVNTPGYSRQQVVITSRDPQQLGGLEFGLGVEISATTNIVNEFTELRLRDVTSDKGKDDATATNLSQVESVFNEADKKGLSTDIAAFFNAWHGVAADPSKTPPRQDLLSKAGIMVNRFNELSQKMEDMRNLIDTEIEDKVSQINTLATQIYNLNGKIKESGGDSLALEDERRFKVREMAELIDVTAVETSQGDFQVYIAQGLQIVNGDRGVGALSTSPNGSNAGLVNVTFAIGVSAASTVTSRINDGSLKGLLDVRDTYIPGYQSQLDELAYEVATEVNSVHTTGFDLSGNTTISFFGSLASSSDAAANIALHASVNGLPRAIAASDTAAKVPGGNSVALSIANLQKTNITFTSKTTTFNEYYSDMLADIGNDTAAAKNNLAFSEEVYDQTKVQREKISGVSLEEEQLNLVRYQSALEASAQLVKVASDVLRILVQLGE